MIGDFETGATSSEGSDEDIDSEVSETPFGDPDAALHHYGNILDELPDLAEALGEAPTEGEAYADADDAAPAQDTLADAPPPAPEMPGDWLYEVEDTEVLDYEAESESLILVWDDMAEGASEPEVKVEEDPFDSDVRHVLANGKPVAEIYGDPNLNTADITMMPLSSALIVGLEPA